MKKSIPLLAALASLIVVAPTAQAQDALKPQQTFQFQPNAYGCLSKDKFDTAYRYSQAGEAQKMQKYFSGYECLSTPEHSKFRIVRVVGHDVEFVNATSGDTKGLWTHVGFIKP